jgi:hypothetical protein
LFVALATFALFAWGLGLLWLHDSDPIASVRIEQCRNAIKGVKCTAVLRTPDGSEKTVHIDDGGYYLRGETADAYIHGDRAYKHWQTPAIPVLFVGCIGLSFTWVLMWFVHRPPRLSGGGAP